MRRAMPVRQRRSRQSRDRSVLHDLRSRPAGPRAIRGYREAILSISEALGRTLDLTAILRKILQTTFRTLRADQGSILLLEEDRLKMLASKGLPRSVVRQGYLPRKGGIAEWVLARNQPVILGKNVPAGLPRRQAGAQPRGRDLRHAAPFSSIATERRLLSSMCAPLRIKGKAIGVINVSRSSRDAAPRSGSATRCAFTRRDLEMLVIMGSQAAISIENARLHEQQLRAQRLAMVGEIVAEIGHGVKNTLTLVRGGAGLCEAGAKTRNWEHLDAALPILKSGISRLGLVVADLLDYSKDREPDLTPVNLAHMVKQVCEAVAFTASGKNVTVEHDVAPDLPGQTGASEIRSDENYLHRSLLNLVLNALDAVPQGGRIAISVARVATPKEMKLRAERCTLIRVADTGCGIERENLEKIFDPFFSTKAGRGTGLGLAVTKKFVERLNGRITVESTVGEGTIFSIFLPARQGGAQ